MRPELLVPANLQSVNVLDALRLVEAEVDQGIVATWTPLEMALAHDWAMRVHLRASDRLVRVRPKPSFVQAAERVTEQSRQILAIIDPRKAALGYIARAGEKGVTVYQVSGYLRNLARSGRDVPMLPLAVVRELVVSARGEGLVRVSREDGDGIIRPTPRLLEAMK